LELSEDPLVKDTKNLIKPFIILVALSNDGVGNKRVSSGHLHVIVLFG